MWEKEKCFAGQLEQKVSDSLFPIQSGAQRGGPGPRHVTVLGPADSLPLAGGDLLRAGQWPGGRGHCELSLYVCVCV